MEKKNTYHGAIDGMRVVAILAVVAIHTSTRILEASSFNIQGYIVAFFINQVCRFAVPLFFMISGFVLEVSYPYHQSYLSYLRKRLYRVFFPYAFWTGIYYFFVFKHHSLLYFYSLLRGSASYQLYFIPALIIFYLFFPLLHKYKHFFLRSWVLIILCVIEMLLLTVEYYIYSYPIFYPLKIVFLNYFVFVLGMVASHNYKT